MPVKAVLVQEVKILKRLVGMLVGAVRVLLQAVKLLIEGM
jgi:hypothetical protein